MAAANPRSTPFPRTGWVAACILLAACEREPTNYFPLEPERSWHYTIERTTMDGTTTQKYPLATLPTRTWNGLQVGGKRTVDGRQYFYHAGTDGVRRVGRKLHDDEDIRAEQPSLMVLPADPRVGSRWQQPAETSVLENTGPPWETLFRITRPLTLEYRIESVTDVVRVPAGEFRDCLRVVASGELSADVGNYVGRTAISVEVTEWYAPGVGLVRSRRVERTDAKGLNYGALEMQLQSYY